jgi:hypothetical protein
LLQKERQLAILSFERKICSHKQEATKTGEVEKKS